ISGNQTTLNMAKATRELCDFLPTVQHRQHKHLLLECTNLPPYKAALQQITKLPVTDILTLIEATQPGTVQQRFL
ncbi:MAG: hypothetical protein WBC93_08260, partial [Sulfitobacter sp.]